MPLSTIKRRDEQSYDYALSMRQYDAAAISATASTTGLQFPVRKSNAFRVVINMATYGSYTQGSAEWSFAVQISDVVGGTYTTIQSITPSNAAQEVVFAFSGEYCEAMDSDAEFIRVTATKTGAPGNLSYGAYITPAN